MDLSAIILASVLGVQPGQTVANNNQPYHGGQPVIRRFERREEDDARRRSWEVYVRELDDLWLEYRESGSTPRAWQRYKTAAMEAKRSYVYRDPYLAPVTP